MLADHVTDQASGLRHLISRHPPHVWLFMGSGPGCGVTSLVVNLATTMALADRNVLILDEHVSPGNVANAMGLKPRHDMLHAVRGDHPLSEVLLPALPGLQVLPVARAMQALPKMNADERRNLQDGLSAVSRRTEVVLMDASGQEGGLLMRGLAPGQRLVLVMEGTGEGLMATYGLIKRLVQAGEAKQFGIVINRLAGAAADVLYANLCRVTLAHLKIRPDYLGFIPLDEQMARATRLGSCVVGAFPASPASRTLQALGRSLIRSPLPARGESGSLPGMIGRIMGLMPPAGVSFS